MRDMEWVLLEYVYLSFIINYFELQESIDFNS